MAREHMRRTLFATVASALLAVSVIGSAGARQIPPGAGEGWSGELDHAARQLIALAEATPADKFAWRPADGVRSVAEVYMHVAIGNHLLLGRAGVEPAVDLAKLGQDPEKSITDKAGVIAFLRDSFAAVRKGYSSVDHAKKVRLLNKDVTAGDVFLRILVHNHEHMGQAVAYARVNGIAPPWSQ
jgi:uncharacterized damage-inducible protein DinB